MNFRTLAEGLGFTEGPVWRSDGTVLVTSIDRGALYSVSEDGVELVSLVGGGPNGATEGAVGEIFITQSGGAYPASRVPGMTGGVQVTSPKSAEVTWLSRDLICPNDLCLGSDGCLYVTDPTRRSARDDGRIWRVEVQSGDAELLGSVPWYPNGIGFGEDGALYVASTGERRIVRVEINGSRLGSSETVVQMRRGLPDGFAFDTVGHIVIAAMSDDDAPGSVQVWDIDGREVEIIEPSAERYLTNLALSGTRLALCASSTGRVLVCDDWPHEGLPLHPFRGPSSY